MTIDLSPQLRDGIIDPLPRWLFFSPTLAGVLKKPGNSVVLFAGGDYYLVRPLQPQSTFAIFE